MSEFQSRILVHDETFDASGFTDQNSLAKALMDKPDTLTPVVTFLFGSCKASADRFPLLHTTEGQKNGAAQQAINSIEYTWPFIGKRKTTETIAATQYSASDKPGVGNSYFFADFKSNWFGDQATIRNGRYDVLARVFGMPTRNSNGTYRYKLKMFNPDPSAYCPAGALGVNEKWGIAGASTVSPSMSVGNYGRVQSPGKRKNQISVIRKSYRLAGNISNKVVEFQLQDKSGNKSSYWIDWYEFQQMLAWREEKELQLWLSEYSRGASGVNALKDEFTGQIIPTGAGLKQQIPNSHTYTKMTEKLIRNVLGDTFRGAPDTGMMDIVVYCGEGFQEDFDQAMKDSKLFRLVAESTGDKFVQSKGGHLQLGGYFRSYVHSDGHVITLKKLPFLDHGGYSDASPRHPISGRPMSSHEAYFVDHSRYDNVPNLQMVYEKGRMEIRGLHQGMSLVKGRKYGDYKGNSQYLNLATEQDASSIHFMSTCGLQMLRDTHSFKLLPDVNQFY